MKKIVASLAGQLKNVITNPRAQARTATTTTQPYQVPPGADFPSLQSALLPRPKAARAPKVEYDVACQLAAEGISGGPDARELNRLRDLQAQWVKMQREAFVNYTPQQARADFVKKDMEQWKTFYESGQELKDFKAIGLDHLLLDYSAKMALARKTLLEVEQQSLKVCHPIRERFLKSASQHLKKLESDERSDSERFGIEYHPSARVTVLRSLVARLKHNHDNQTPGSPKNLLPFVQL